MTAIPFPQSPAAWRPAPVPRSGYSAFDELEPIAAGQVTLVESWGAPSACEGLLFGLLVGAVAQGREAALVDGGNVLDVYRLSHAARVRGISPEHVLGSVKVARGFTAYQLQSLVEDRLAGAVGERTGLLAVSCFSDMYLDEDVPPAEGRVLAKRALASLRALARERDLPAVVTVHGLPSVRGAQEMQELLHEGVDEIVGVARCDTHRDRMRDADFGLRIALPRRGVQVLSRGPGARQRSLSEFGEQRAYVPPVARRRAHVPGWKLGYYREGRRGVS